MRIATVGTWALVLLCAGCFHAEEHFRATALDRAAFDMQCPKAQIQVLVLHESSVNTLESQIGVSGCGKRGVYVLVQGGAWVLNSTNDSIKPDEAATK